MAEVSQAQVEAAKASLKSAQSAFPEGGINSAAATLEAVISMLGSCWDTVGGAREQAKLKSLAGANLDCTALESSIASIKGMEVTASTTEHSLRIAG